MANTKFIFFNNQPHFKCPKKLHRIEVVVRLTHYHMCISSGTLDFPQNCRSESFEEKLFSKSWTPVMRWGKFLSAFSESANNLLKKIQTTKFFSNSLSLSTIYYFKSSSFFVQKSQNKAFLEKLFQMLTLAGFSKETNA